MASSGSQEGRAPSAGPPPQPWAALLCAISVSCSLEPGAAVAPSPSAAPSAQVPALQLAQAPFRARRERALPAKPVGVCAADFDGDGASDLALTFLAPGGSIVWHGSPTGLGREGALRACGDWPLAPLALPRGHFGAGDREQRLALCSRAAKSLEVIAPFAAAGAANSFAPRALEKTPRALAAGILAGGAVLAIACSDKRLELLREGSAQVEHWNLSGALPTCAFISEELSAVLVGFQDSTAIEAYASASATPIDRLQLSGIPRDMAALDIDGDGDKELVVAGGDHELWIFGSGKTNAAQGWFESGTPLVWQTGAIPLQLVVADFDGDQRSDLAVLHHYDLSVSLLTKLSASGPGTTSSLYAGQTPWSFAALDGDGDGALDIAVANRDTQGLGFLPGNGAGALVASQSISLGDFPNALAAAPKSDTTSCALRLVALNAKSHGASPVVFEGNVLHSLPEAPTGPEPRAPQIAELDGKPGLDVLLLGSGARGAQLVLLTGDPAGKLSPAGVLELGGAASDLALLDVDQDGRSELAICDPAAATVLLCEAAAARAEATGLSHAVRLRVPSQPCALCRIELDGDAASELACVLAAPGERVGIAWLDARRNSGGELSLTELGFSALPGAPIDAVSCDLNGDGRLDLAVLTNTAAGSTGGAWFALLRGPGGPSDFWLSEPQPTGQRPHRIAAADLDGDGCAEVFVAAQDSHLVNAWTPNGVRGARSFSVRAWDDLGAGRGPLDLCLSDVDGDGSLDLCVANGFSNDVSVLHGRAPVKAK